MLNYPDIDPIIFSIGPLHLRWYGLMYVLGFAASYFLAAYQIRKFSYTKLADHFENINFVLIISVVIGGRLGYVLFYNPAYYLANPLEIFATWTGGMSFHGACLALIISGWLYARKHGINFWRGADVYVATIPIGLGLGRVGNFINGELFGKVTDAPWGMIFPYGGPLPRHPSQLYEAFLEGAVLFGLLWWFKEKPYKNPARWPHGTILALFLIFYGVFRMGIELVREPDQHLGYFFDIFTMGQLLSALMVMVGGIILWLRRRKQVRDQSK